MRQGFVFIYARTHLALILIYVRTHQWFSSETNVLSLFMWEHINDSQVKPRSCLYLCENTSIIFKWGKCLVFIYVRIHQWFSSVAKALSLFMWEHINDSQVRPRHVFIYVRTHQWFSNEAKVLSLFMWEHINDTKVRSRSCLYLCENTSMILKWGQGLVFIYMYKMYMRTWTVTVGSSQISYLTSWCICTRPITTFH